MSILSVILTITSLFGSISSSIDTAVYAANNVKVRYTINNVPAFSCSAYVEIESNIPTFKACGDLYGYKKLFSE